MNVKWVGDGLNECAIDDSGKTIVKVDSKYFRPSEVETLLGDSTKAINLLNWKPEIQFDMLVKEMVDSDLNLAKKELSDRE